MNIQLNEYYCKLTGRYLFSETNRRAREYAAAHPDQQLIRMGIGDVTLPLPQVAIDAMHAAVDEQASAKTFRGYPPEYGYDFLRQAIADYYTRFGVRLSLDEIFVSDGAKSDVGNLPDILGANEVLIPDPVYPVYFDSNFMAGRHISLLPSTRENGFLPTPEGLKKEPQIIYLCSPNNPTGAVYDREGLKAWVDFALESGSLIVFDAAYEAFIRGDLPHSIYEIPGAKQCAVEVCSFSKMAGFTGVRCAWAVYPTDLVSEGTSVGQLWARRQATKFNGVPYIVQRAAQAVLTDKGIAQCRENLNYYKGNADLMAQLLSDKGIYFTGGVHSPYLWLQCPNGMGSWEFFDYLLNKVQVLGTPGEGFGACGAGYFRLTAFGTREDTEKAVCLLRELL